MAALTAARSTLARLTPRTRTVPVAANAVIQQGGQVQINAAGFAVPASATVANITIGMAKAAVNNTGGANGALTVDVDRGVFRFANSAAADLIARTEIGATVYVVDDQTVAKTNGGATRPAAGKCFDVDASGVWVEYL
jgi:hypothetical protein